MRLQRTRSPGHAANRHVPWGKRPLRAPPRGSAPLPRPGAPGSGHFPTACGLEGTKH
jgi:hypothetical protein